MPTDQPRRRLRLAALLAPFFLFTSIYAFARAKAAARLGPAPPAGQRRPGQGGKPRSGQQKDSKPKEEPGFFPRPLEGNYPVSLAVAIVALTPFIIVTTAYAMFSQHVQAELGVGRRATEIVEGLSTAAYAFGALLGGDLVQRFRQRRMFLLCEALFIVGTLASATAHGMLPYGAGRILSGLSTGMLLVAALPPVIQRYGPEKLPITVIFINLGFFGAVCIGPLLGGWVAAGHSWRWFFAALGAIATLNLFVALFALPKMPPINPGLKFDAPAVTLALLATALPFWASGELAAHDFTSYRFAVPMGIGLMCFIALLLVEYHGKEPLSPVKKMWITPSLFGTLIAMIGGGVFVTLLELIERLHMSVLHQAPLQTGLLLWPLVVGVCITALMLGGSIRTRYLFVLVMGGMVTLIGAAVMTLFLGPNPAPMLTLATAGVLGLGAGATVSPALFLAGLPLPSQIIGRVFALVELVRSVADYIIAPVLMRIAQNGSSGTSLDWGGVHEAVWITLWLTVAFALLAGAFWVLGSMKLTKPDLRGWLQEGKTAIPSTPPLALLRRAS